MGFSLGCSFGVLLVNRQLPFEDRALLRIARLGDLPLQHRESVGDRTRAVRQIGSLLQGARTSQTPPRRVVADDGDIGPEDLIPECVIVVIVRVHDVFDRLVRQRFDVGDKSGCRSGGDTGIDDHDVCVVDNDDGVAADSHRARRRAVVHAFGNFLELMRGQRTGRRWHRHRPAAALRLCQDGVREDEQGNGREEEFAHKESC